MTELTDKLGTALQARIDAEDDIADIMRPYAQVISEFLGRTRYHKDELRVESVHDQHISFSVRNWDFDVVQVDIPTSILEDDAKMDEIKRRREIASLRSELNRLNTMSGVTNRQMDDLRELQFANTAQIAKVTAQIAKYEEGTK